MGSILTDKCQIRDAEQRLTNYIENNPEMFLEDARYFRANVRDQKKTMCNREFFEIFAMTEADIQLSGLSEIEKKVCNVRLNLRTNSYKEIDEALEFETKGSTSAKIYARAIRKIGKYLMLSEKEKLKILLSPLEFAIHTEMQKGKTNREIANKLGKTLGNIKATKTRLFRKLNKIENLSYRNGEG